MVAFICSLVLLILAPAIQAGVVSLTPYNDGFILHGNTQCAQTYCAAGSSLKAYQTERPATCYGCNRRIVMSFSRPDEFTGDARFEIEGATLSLYKTWDGRQHGWRGNDRYTLRAVHSNWTDSHLMDAGLSPELAPAVLDNAESATIIIPPGTGVWHNLDVGDFVRMLYNRPEYNGGAVSFDLAGAAYGSLSAFRGSAVEGFEPRLNITYRVLTTTAAPTSSAPSVMPTTTPPSPSPTDAPSFHPCTDGSHGCSIMSTYCAMHPDVPSSFTCECVEGLSRVSDTECTRTVNPTAAPTTASPTVSPSESPTLSPSGSPTAFPTGDPTVLAYPIGPDGQIVYPTDTSGVAQFVIDEWGNPVVPTDSWGNAITARSDAGRVIPLPATPAAPTAEPTDTRTSQSGASSVSDKSSSSGTSTAILAVLLVLVTVGFVAYIFITKSKGAGPSGNRGVGLENPTYGSDIPGAGADVGDEGMYSEALETGSNNNSGYMDIPRASGFDTPATGYMDVSPGKSFDDDDAEDV